MATSFSLKVQANLFVGDQCGTKFCSKFSNMTIPIAWAEAVSTNNKLHDNGESSEK